MAPLQSLTMLVLSLVLATTTAITVPTERADTGNCVDFFTATGATLSGAGNIVILDIDMDETTPVDQHLYTLSWEGCDTIDAEAVTDPDFNKYFTIDKTTMCMWKVLVKTSLVGLPDFPTIQNKITGTTTFDGFRNPQTCTVMMNHNIKDINTQKPVPEAVTFEVPINENFPTGYTIENFVNSVHDLDETSPNNQFTVTTDAKCPLEVTEAIYTSGQDAQDVKYKLKESLNFEGAGANPIVCTVTFQDKAVTGALTDTANISINILDVPDEPPVFDKEYYETELTSNEVTPDLILSTIKATDGDTAINAPITYSMTNLNTADGLDYFQLNKDTGEVTQVKDLDDAFLKNGVVLFSVKANDLSQTATTVLQIKLPTTCEPCDPAVRELSPTCEPCPTCPTPEPPIKCPTAGTCRPCPPPVTCPMITCPTCPTHPFITCPPCVPPTTPTQPTCEPCTCPTTKPPTQCPTQGTCPTCPPPTTCPTLTCPTTTIVISQTSPTSPPDTECSDDTPPDTQK